MLYNKTVKWEFLRICQEQSRKMLLLCRILTEEWLCVLVNEQILIIYLDLSSSYSLKSSLKEIIPRSCTVTDSSYLSLCLFSCLYRFYARICLDSSTFLYLHHHKLSPDCHCLSLRWVALSVNWVSHLYSCLLYLFSLHSPVISFLQRS